MHLFMAHELTTDVGEAVNNVEAPNAPSEVVSDGDEVEGKVCCLLPVPTDPSPTPGMALHGGGGGIGSTGSPISVMNINIHINRYS